MTYTDKFGQELGDIQQIIPALGWFAQYRKDGGGLWEFPVAFWAVVEEKHDGGVTVVGIDMGEGYPDACSGAANFLRYVHQEQLGVDPDDEG